VRNDLEEVLHDTMNDENLVRYMRDVRKYTILDAETEAELVRRWRDRRDPKAAERLVGSHQRLVVKIASQYRRFGNPLSDLISEGNVGLMQAVEKFDLDRGYRLSTYAMWWIRAAITEYVVRSSSLVRVATNENRRKLFFNLGRLKAKYRSTESGQLTPAAVTAIATDLQVPEEEVVLMDRHLGERDLSLNTAIAGESDPATTWQDRLADDSPSQEVRVIDSDENDKRHSLLAAALSQLDERERRILVERKLTDDPPRLAELSVEFGISRERVRQIEARAFEKLRKLMQAAAAAGGLIAEAEPTAAARAR
jgi:RNA polymerase sigma-32 factor